MQNISQIYAKNFAALDDNDFYVLILSANHQVGNEIAGADL